MGKFQINDKYVKIRNIQGKYYGVHLFTDEVLYDPYIGKISHKLSEFTKRRIIKATAQAIEYHNQVNKNEA